MTASASQLLAILLGALVGGGLFILVLGVRGVEPGPARTGPGPLERLLRDFWSLRGLLAVLAGVAALVVTRWLVAGIGIALLAFVWRGLGGAVGERRAIERLDALAIWTESLRDTIAGAVGLEQAIPSSLRVAAPSLREPLSRLVDRMHTRMPVADALHAFADDLDDPAADLIIAALIINARLRGPGLRDLLGSLATSVREELDMRRKVTADRKSTRRSVQIVVGVSVGLAVVLSIIDHSFLTPYDGLLGQAVLTVVVAIYAAGIVWLRSLARFDTPERLLGGPVAVIPAQAAPGAVAWQDGGAG